MNARQSRWTAALLALTAGSALAAAPEPGEPTLKVGDRAPKLQTGKWVQGDPVQAFEKGKAYLVEFWATWCGPCRVSIPHLNELHTKYKDKGLVVIGQNCWEHNEKLVEPFVKKMGDKMTYRVALDNKEESERGQMAETWMAAAGRNGIPSAFLVDTQGRIAWIDHPMQLKEQVIEEVLARKFDLAKAAVQYEENRKKETQLRAVWRDLSRAMQKKDWEEAEAQLAEAEKLMPESGRDNLGPMRFNLLVRKQDFTAAYKLAGQLSDAHPEDALMQNQLAWQILTDESLEKRDLALAEKIARRANAAAQSRDPGILDTLARALFMQGKKEAALELQEKAVQLADGEMKESLRTTLESYKKGHVPKQE